VQGTIKPMAADYRDHQDDERHPGSPPRGRAPSVMQSADVGSMTTPATRTPDLARVRDGPRMVSQTSRETQPAGQLMAEVGQVWRCTFEKKKGKVSQFQESLGLALRDKQRDLVFRLIRLKAQIRSEDPTLELFKVTADVTNVDSTMLSPLPLDTDVPAMRQCLHTLEAFSLKVSQWEARLDNVPSACPTGLALLHEVKGAMEVELVRMFTELREGCRPLTANQQEVAFQFAPDWQNVDNFMQQIIPKVDENDEMQVQCHRVALQHLARRFSRCEDQFESLCRRF